ncbi:MAG TPA: 16S rRNA (adenine(1518)-N(6)/adenine(1519)-N(6))-dimethyltransferase RsmA [Pseudonocardia sp.]|uniref:16S rRNA (adenine(1518)-N(6)/adenine(1519)-N(6))- dimethyltransferase RsmA n=1 Tax=Pseudonocardia sp. TaxID=60912 RepID=UPI002EDB16F9
MADRLGLRPTKRLGQNFVHDANTVRRIARLAELDPDDVVLEIGPGLGSLTLALLPSAASVLAVEIDPVLAEALPGTVAERAPALAARLTVLTTDALRLTAEQLPRPPTAVVANLPYNVGVPVLLHVLESLPSVRHGLVMIQSEVVDRLAAPPGGREYGAPSAKLAWFASARRVGPVPRAVFWPVPGVDSALLAVRRRPAPEISRGIRVASAAEGEPAGAEVTGGAATEVTGAVAAEVTGGVAAEPAGGAATEVTRAEVFAVVDAAFAQRRKSLRGALAGWAGSPAAAEQVLRAAGVDPATRAERLAIADFARIAAASPRRPS